MSQEEVEEYLKEREKASISEIANALNLCFATVWRNLNAMMSSLKVEKIKLTKEEVENIGKSYTGRHYAWRLVTS